MRRPPAGYTLLELVVVLAILGAVTALVAPSAIREIDRWRARLALQDLAQQVQRLPTLARQAGTAVDFDGRSGWPRALPPLRVEGGELNVLRPLRVQVNGFCEGGRLRLQRGEAVLEADVLAPFCVLAAVEPVAPP